MNTQINERITHLISNTADLSRSLTAHQYQKIIIARFINETLLVCLLQFIGLTITFQSSTPFAVSFATGTAAAFVFLRGYTVALGIGLGSFLAYLFAASGFGIACISATVLTLQSLALLFLCYRYIGPTLQFTRLEKFYKFLMIVCLITGVSIFIVSQWCYQSLSFYAYMRLWLAYINGIVVFACPIIAWDTYFHQASSIKRHGIQYTVIYGSLTVLIMGLLYGQSFFYNHMLLLGVLVVLMTTLSVFYHWCGSMAGIFLLGFLFNFGAYLDAPLFIHHYRIDRMVALQCYIFALYVLCGSIVMIRRKNYRQSSIV